MSGEGVKPGITGVVLSSTGGVRLLERCLASLAFCDYLLIVDSFSSDATLDIARAAGGPERVRILQRAWENIGAQFAFALPLVETEWVLILDQDEVCTAQLEASIRRAIAVPTAPDGFYISRRSWYYDHFLRHSGWHPDYLLRCFRNGRVEIRLSGAHHTFHPLGATKILSGKILHYPYSGFRQHLDKINDYAQRGANDLAAKGRSGGLAHGLLHGIGRFARIYLLKRGFLDGRAGFINAAHGAFYAFLKYVRVGEGSWGYPYDHDRE